MSKDEKKSFLRLSPNYVLSTKYACPVKELSRISSTILFEVISLIPQGDNKKRENIPGRVPDNTSTTVSGKAYLSNDNS